MNFYCTLFDSNYLTRGMAMYQSLVNSGEKFQLYIACFDDLSFEILNTLSLDSVIPISLAEFETEELLQVKKLRTQGEYCWTCTPFVIRYIIDTYNLPEVTYLDADLYFFNKPDILLTEFRNSGKSVMITEHRYTPEYDYTDTSGIYCVQFMSFKADMPGIRVLQWWQDRCLEWCYARFEDGKFGDQKYLDDWTDRFDCIHVLEHLGGGVAPWNIQQYHISEGPMINGIDIVFYHFHAFKWMTSNIFDMGIYKLDKNDKKYIYYPYIDTLKKSLQLVQEKYDAGFINGIQNEKTRWKDIIRKLKRKLKRQWKGVYNVVQR